MPTKDKDRLYLTLNHRHDKPGYHWAIVLAPVDKHASQIVNDSTRWDITNEGSASKQWRFREHMVNQYKSISLCARVLLAKYNPDERKSNEISIKTEMESTEIRQNDPTFTCRVWVMNVIQALRDKGFIKLNTPSQVALEARVKAFGDECMQRIQSREVDIAAGGIAAIPVLDLRK